MSLNKAKLSGGKILLDSTNVRNNENKKSFSVNSKKSKLVANNDRGDVVIKETKMKEDSLEYWKNLSEEKRKILEVSLVENDVLHAEYFMIKKEVAELNIIYEEIKEMIPIFEEYSNDSQNENEQA